MGNVELLDKTRRINKLLRNVSFGKEIFNDICLAFCDILSSNVLILDRTGRVLGIGMIPSVGALGELVINEVGAVSDAGFNERLLNVLSTKENVNPETLGFPYGSSRSRALITPVDIAGERLGTIFAYREKTEYGIDDIILCEYGAAVAGLEMMRYISEENDRSERDFRAARAAVNSLSDTETDAFLCVMDKLPEGGGTLVTSRIADEAGITRSVVVNALKKLEGAGVIEARSSGMRGTRINVVNTAVYDEARRLRDAL